MLYSVIITCCISTLIYKYCNFMCFGCLASTGETNGENGYGWVGPLVSQVGCFYFALLFLFVAHCDFAAYRRVHTTNHVPCTNYIPCTNYLPCAYTNYVPCACTVYKPCLILLTEMRRWITCCTQSSGHYRISSGNRYAAIIEDTGRSSLPSVY